MCNSSSQALRPSKYSHKEKNHNISQPILFCIGLFLMPYVKQQWLLLIKVIVSIQETKYQESMKTFVHVLNLPRISRATEYI